MVFVKANLELLDVMNASMFYFTLAANGFCLDILYFLSMVTVLSSFFFFFKTKNMYLNFPQLI